MAITRLIIAYVEDLVYFQWNTSGFITLGSVILWIIVSVSLLDFDNLGIQFLAAIIGLGLISIGIANLALKALIQEGNQMAKRPLENTNAIPSILAYCQRHSKVKGSVAGIPGCKIGTLSFGLNGPILEDEELLTAEHANSDNQTDENMVRRGKNHEEIITNIEHIQLNVKRKVKHQASKAFIDGLGNRHELRLRNHVKTKDPFGQIIGGSKNRGLDRGESSSIKRKCEKSHHHHSSRLTTLHCSHSRPKISVESGMEMLVKKTISINSKIHGFRSKVSKNWSQIRDLAPVSNPIKTTFTLATPQLNRRMSISLSAKREARF